MLLSFVFLSSACTPSGKHQPVEASSPTGSTTGLSGGGDHVLFSDVKSVFKESCMSCHFDKVSAPKINWLDYSSAKAKSAKLGAYMEADRMPPKTSSEKATFTEADKALILAWVNDGALEVAPQEGDTGSGSVASGGQNDGPPTVVLDDDIKNFQMVQTCTGCHGQYGMSFGGTPHLAGLSQPYILDQLKAFAGTYPDVEVRNDSPTMADMVAGLTEENLVYLSEYFGSLKYDADKLDLYDLDEEEKEIYAKGERLNQDYACLGCHNNSAQPKIAGQDETYIEGSLNAFKEKLRPATNMAKVIEKVSEDDFYALALYLSRQTKSPQTTLDNLSSDNVAHVYKTQCASCHAGSSYSSVPKLDDLNPSYVRLQLRDFSNNKRQDLAFGYMNKLDLDSGKIKILSDYMKTLNSTCEEGEADITRSSLSDEDFKRAEGIVKKCSSCHVNKSGWLYPRLYGQSEDYLVTNMMAFKSGERKSSVMQGQIRRVNEEEIKLISKYLSEIKTCN